MLSPLIPEVGLLALPYHNFDSSWMTPHHVLTRLASYFNVLWLEPAHHWREMRELRERRDAYAAMARSLPVGFLLYVPEVWLPDLYRPARLRDAIVATRIRHGWRRLERFGARKRVLHLWHHQFESALAADRYDLSLYHVDDEYTFSADQSLTDPREMRVIRKVDQVFAISPRLMERKGGINPHTSLVPEGVDFDLYSTPVPAPSDLASIPHPRIGYTGNLKTQLDWHLLKSLAARHPTWSFVFVGPNVMNGAASATLNEMSRFPNVHFLGRKTVRELAAYPQHFDVCLMPYVVDGYTENIYPLKLHEYLASGRPVVGTPIRSLQSFQHVIDIACTVDDWSAALPRALEPAMMQPNVVEARQAAAQEHDWSELVYRIAQTICERLGPEHAKRLWKIKLTTPEISPRGS